MFKVSTTSNNMGSPESTATVKPSSAVGAREPLLTCIAIGDPHFQVSNAPDCEMLIERIRMLVDHNKPDFVVVLGDTLHLHEKIHVTPLNLVTKFFTMLTERVKTFVLIGNHDMINHSQFLTENHGFNSYKKWPNMTICDTVKEAEIKGQTFVFCPYVPNGRFVEALETGDKKLWREASCIFAHQEFFGCRFNPMQVSTEGDIWPEDNPLIVSGHIHGEQRLQSNIYYPGSSMQHGFGDTDEKIIALLTFTEKGTPFGLQRVDIQLPKKKTWYLDVQNADAFVPPPGVMAKLVIKGRPEQIRMFRRSDAFKKLIKMGVKISFSPKIDQTADLKSHTMNGVKKNVMVLLEEMVKESTPEIKAAYVEIMGRSVEASTAVG
jgi:DNA repair exonuclease SbcCD nuclease subunit